MEGQVVDFLESLTTTCSLDGVIVTCVERSFRPISQNLKQALSSKKVRLRTCHLPQVNNCREDTSKFADWMVDNVGNAPWVIVAHFDVYFTGDYVTYVRSLIRSADMIGNHHDGMVAVRRTAYAECQVGFCGTDMMHVVQNQNGWAQILPRDSPHASVGHPVLSLDVGELLAIRMHTLGLRHVWYMKNGELGKSHYFEHMRQGSDHSGGAPRPYRHPPKCQTQPECHQSPRPHVAGIQIPVYSLEDLANFRSIRQDELDIHLNSAGGCLCGVSGHRKLTTVISAATCNKCLDVAARFPGKYTR